MTRWRRFSTIIVGLLTILAAFVIFLLDDAYKYIILILGLSMLVSGLRYLFYYGRMARHMVGGKIMLVIGAVFISFGLFTLNLSDEPLIYLILYLLGFHAFSGLINLLRALEARQYDAPSWKLTFATGIVNILVAIASPVWGILFKSPDTLTLIYCLGLIYSGIIRIITALRRTAIVYIQ